MAGCIRRVAVVVSLAVMASLLSFSPANAQVAPGGADHRPAPTPEAFEPGDINRTS